MFRPKQASEEFDDWFKFVDINGDGQITRQVSQSSNNIQIFFVYFREEFKKKGKQRLNDIRRNSAFFIDDE